MSNFLQDDTNNVDVLMVEAFITDTRIVVAAAALYCYEWLVTFDQEINHIWRRKWTLSTWIFAISRYATMLLVILQMLPTPNHIKSLFSSRFYRRKSDPCVHSCSWEIRLEQIFDILQLLTSALFSGVRVFALCDRNIPVFLVVLCLSLVPPVDNMVVFVQQTLLFADAYPTNICVGILPFSAGVELRCTLSAFPTFPSAQTTDKFTVVSLGTQIAVVASDIIVLAVSWRKALGTVREASRLNIETPLSMVLIRDGTLYFLALLFINILLTLSTNVPAFAVISPGNTLAVPLTSIVVSRFLLNLKQAGQGPNVASTVHRSTIHFNIGPEDGDADVSNGDFDRTGDEEVRVATELQVGSLEGQFFASSSNHV